MKIKIICNCPECDGYGVVADRNSNDPDAKYRDCYECDGSGKISYVDTYDSISDAQDDYPQATGFTYQ